MSGKFRDDIIIKELLKAVIKYKHHLSDKSLDETIQVFTVELMERDNGWTEKQVRN